MQPIAQTSIGVEYSGASSKSSGAQYHNVTTCLVYGHIGIEYALASPKSPIFTFPSESIKIFYGFRSQCIIRRECNSTVPSSNPLSNFYLTFLYKSLIQKLCFR